MPTLTPVRAVCASHIRYLAGCPDCQTAGAVRSRTRTRLIAYGQWEGLHDSTAVVTHIQQLLSAGISRNAIADRAAVSQTVICRLASGVQQTVRADTARKVLAVTPVLPPSAPVNSLGAARRLQALMAAGWDASTLAPMLDTSVNQVRRWRWQSQPSMRFDVHQRIQALYQRLEGKPGPSVRTQRQAQRLGYAAPIHWDDDGDLDSPKARPKGVRKAVV